MKNAIMQMKYFLNDFLLENLELVDKLQMWDFQSIVFWSKFCFLRLFWGILASVILRLIVVNERQWLTFLLRPLTFRPPLAKKKFLRLS